MLSLNELNCKIDYLRTHLIEIGMLQGLSHPETVKSSQELDKLLYQFQRNILK
ncbi:Spo0E family sporulation regulatory protein-aspartic acid phosphatase [Peribacillus sp. NPDC076916]|uniref:Spo0E family sporulation regulatory protein-aspartic acid phosphatase n=1 Tax=Peribacillus sp. NPDC076916 TaxID=3390608 RepID=UPI003D085960